MKEQTKFVPTPEALGGIRKRYRAAMSDDRFVFPRKSVLNHRVEWYLDGTAAVARPTYGLYALANFAEYLLHHARFGKRNQRRAFREAAEFYAATRRALQNALSTFSIRTRLDSEGVGTLRAKVLELVEGARVAYDAVAHGAADVECPVCKGKGLSRADARLLDAILVEQSKNGTIPKTSELYRLTPTPGL